MGQSSGWPSRPKLSTEIPGVGPYPEGEVGQKREALALCRVGKTVGAALGRQDWGPEPLRKAAVGMGAFDAFWLTGYVNDMQISPLLCFSQ